MQVTILSSYLCLDIFSGLFPHGYPIKILYAFLFSPKCATRIPNLILVYSITVNIILRATKVMKLPLCSFLQLPTISFISGSKYSLKLCSQIPSVYSLYVRDVVSHPYKTTGKIVALHLVIFMFFESRREDKCFLIE